MIDTAAAEAHAAAAHEQAELAKEIAAAAEQYVQTSEADARRLDDIVRLHKLGDWLVEHPEVPLASSYWTPGVELGGSYRMPAELMRDLLAHLDLTAFTNAPTNDVHFDTVQGWLISFYGAPGELTDGAS